MSEATPPPAPAPVPATDKYHCCIVANADGGAPEWVSSNDLAALKGEVFKKLLTTRNGWCYFVIDGVRCMISQPTQYFSLRLPDGSVSELRDPAGPVFPADGAFRVLEAVAEAR